MGMQMELDMGNQGQISCLTANLTAAPTKTEQLLLQWVPFGMFIFVLLVSMIRTMDQTSASMGASQSTARSTLETLPDVSECLFYLQFAFLSTTLTLSYPRFLQPIMSHWNIYSLFNPGPLAYDHAYPSMADGIYTINGTYGGTLGFELMHQIVGVPQTMDTWYNMIIAILIIAISTAAVLEIRVLMTRASEASDFKEDMGISYRFKNVLRAVLSYFTLPLCALTFYQTNYAKMLPAYHTMLAAVAIFLVLLAFAWLFKKLPSQELGQYIVGPPKPCRLEDDHQRKSNRDGRAFVAMHFALVFARGAVIGSLQHFPAAQLAMLILCELGIVLATFWLRRDQLWTARSLSTIFRMATLALLCCFLPGLTEGRTKDILGYTVLALHASALVLIFLLPAVFHLAIIIWNRSKCLGPEAYGLRQLNRRTKRDAHQSPCLEMLAIEDNYAEPSPTFEKGTELESPDSGNHTPRTSTLMPRQTGYFRQPSRSSMFPVYNAPDSLRSTLSGSSDPEPSEAATTSKVIPERILCTVGDFKVTAPDVDEYNSHSARRPSVPLGPKWDDFTFRESDLVYGAPFSSREPREYQEANRPAGFLEQLRRGFHISGFNWNTFGWTRPKRAQTGFQVVRPSVAYAPSPESTESSNS